MTEGGKGNPAPVILPTSTDISAIACRLSAIVSCGIKHNLKMKC